mmetsp:Transcript_42367/g.78508  ORF Transcript_42367/g.78508 Transcript_42367/m.78508 type:complete len:215 (-) Transcript_42367:320-964(-)
MQPSCSCCCCSRSGGGGSGGKGRARPVAVVFLVDRFCELGGGQVELELRVGAIRASPHPEEPDLDELGQHRAHSLVDRSRVGALQPAPHGQGLSLFHSKPAWHPRVLQVGSTQRRDLSHEPIFFHGVFHVGREPLWVLVHPLLQPSHVSLAPRQTATRVGNVAAEVVHLCPEFWDLRVELVVVSVGKLLQLGNPSCEPKRRSVLFFSPPPPSVF